MAILESVNELAKRFGVETEEQTISEQLDAINQKLDGSYTGSRDIEEAVSQFANSDPSLPPTLQDKTVSPATSEQTITADEGNDGLGTVTVEAVTASIDANIVAENIKDGVTILGVTGTYTG